MAAKQNSLSNRFTLVENYVYIYQLNKYVIIPTYPESVQDTLGSTFQSTQILARTAPIFSYSSSGPRTIQFSLSLHRDLMSQFNYTNSTFITEAGIEAGDDYVDTLVKYLQAMALPSFKVSQVQSAVKQGKTVNPPIAAVRFGNTIFIKGVVNGDVGVTYSGPIGMDGKYQQVEVTFSITETDPQDAETVAQWGSFRGLETALSKGISNK